MASLAMADIIQLHEEIEMVHQLVEEMQGYEITDEEPSFTSELAAIHHFLAGIEMVIESMIESHEWITEWNEEHESN